MLSDRINIPGKAKLLANPLRSYDMKAHIQEVFQERRSTGATRQVNGVSDVPGALGAHSVNGITNGAHS